MIIIHSGKFYNIINANIRLYVNTKTISELLHEMQISWAVSDTPEAGHDRKAVVAPDK